MDIKIIYSFNTVKTAKIADKIADAFGSDQIEKVNAEDITSEKFLEGDALILGVATWFDGELPNYWDEFLPDLEELKLNNKKIALFGLGDQKGYPENFVDALGIMAEILEARGATIVGQTPVEGYKFEHSKGQRGDKFLGLALDYENQASMHKERIKTWVEQLKNEFN